MRDPAARGTEVAKHEACSGNVRTEWRRACAGRWPIGGEVTKSHIILAKGDLAKWVVEMGAT
jgi:hypothetical protein